MKRLSVLFEHTLRRTASGIACRGIRLGRCLYGLLFFRGLKTPFSAVLSLYHSKACSAFPAASPDAPCTGISGIMSQVLELPGVRKGKLGVYTQMSNPSAKPGQEIRYEANDPQRTQPARD
ncbi:MAG: hypothetical protein OHK006_21460 [Thermodesulfovibrionales bacterium]